MEVGLNHGVRVGRLGARGVGVGCTDISQDRRVDASRESGGADVGIGADPVVVNGLVGVKDEGEALPSKDSDAVDGERDDVDSVDFNDSESMSVDGENIVRVARDRDEAKAIPFVSFHGNDGERDGGATSIAAFPIDKSCIGGGYQPGGGCWGMIPISKGDDSGLVVNVISRPMWVEEVVNNHRSSETVTILRHMVGVIPKCTGLVRNAKLVQERMARCDGALGDTSWSVRPRTSGLEKSVPMDASAAQHGGVRQGINDIQVEGVALPASDDGTREGKGARRGTCKDSRSSEPIGLYVLVGNMDVGDGAYGTQRSGHELREDYKGKSHREGSFEEGEA